MQRDDLLKAIAETGYNIGFGAKKHFATFDLVTKVPGYIRFFSISFGIYSLAFDNLSSRFLSASLIVLGVISLYISFYNSRKEEYGDAGVVLIQLFNKLKKLYLRAKTADDKEILEIIEELEAVENEYYSKSMSTQILFSDWYAHYKFFWEFQIDWVDEQKNFKLLRDKVPLTASIGILTLLIFFCWLLFKNSSVFLSLCAVLLSLCQ
ncbi:SLATT domain-containing protein [Leptolyngbya sp. BC1307]|uniref:SLATT domain-containing protein n=1 Tax=Leptolyngbya sp. BC1307 TaxID=2029589 RepID=UPI000EFB5B65|nr:SLATT domain-containing protein [Leptolyngbya sp. BC1307]